MRRFHLVLPLLRPYRVAIVVGLLCVVLTQFAQAYVPQAFRFGLDALAGDSPAVETTLYWAGVLLLVTALRGVFQYVMRRTLVGVSRQLERLLRNRLYERLVRHSPAWLARHHTGDLMARATSDVEAVRWIVGPGVMYIANTLVLAPMAIAYMWQMSPLLTLLNVLPLAGVAIGTRLLAPRLHEASVEMQETQSSMSTRAQESFAGIRVVKSFARERDEEAAFRTEAERSLDANLRYADTRALFFPLIGLMKGLGLVLSVLVGGMLMARGELSLGDFVAIHQYGGMLMWPMISLGWVIGQWERGKVAMGRLSQVIAEPPDIADPPEPVELGAVAGELEIAGLTFQYEGARAPSLSDVTVRVAAGETLAIVGPTGAGKSTLLAAIPRLLDIPPGTVRLDGVAIDRLRVDALRSQIGYVPQDTFLFSATLEENIGFGLDPAERESSDGSRVRDAAQSARILPEIERLPQQFDTVLGERGVNLSGGQRQRTAIARAIALDPRVLLLDDCLSAVDANTEAEILSNLEQVFRGRTTVLVTHRVAAARLADHVLVLEEGRVTAYGTHDELVEGDGFYARLARRQSLEDALEAA